MKNLICLLLFFISFAVNAQKLPGVQQTSLRIPNNLKIDGKAAEWNNKFAAYNKATDIFYTLSNDNDKLYLTLQATDRGIINKIINGGVSLTINKSVKKAGEGAATITYPVFDRKDKPYISWADKESSINEADSLMLINNSRMNQRSKFIKVTGIKGMDTLISVYNMDGIKAAALFDDKDVYTLELSVGLKLTGLAINDHTKFNYNIKLNAISTEDVPGITIARSPNGTITSIDIDKRVAGQFSNSNVRDRFLGRIYFSKVSWIFKTNGLKNCLNSI